VRKILVIGIGAGDPDHVTVQATRALNQLDVVFVMDKGREKQDLVGLRKLLCERYIQRPYRVVELADPVRDPAIADYQARVERWHEQRVALYESTITRELGESECAGILAWGDPSLYDSTLRLLEKMRERAAFPFEYTVIPGITSLSALTAGHRIPLNRIGGPVLITTGRKLSEQGMPVGCDEVVVMLDGEHAFQKIPADGIEIYWGAYLGTQDEILMSGKLSDIAEDIAKARTSARAQHGWIMDIYLLRRNALSRGLDS
jgi:precorrin-6A synthase